MVDTDAQTRVTSFDRSLRWIYYVRAGTAQCAALMVLAPLDKDDTQAAYIGAGPFLGHGSPCSLVLIFCRLNRIDLWAQVKSWGAAALLNLRLLNICIAKRC